MRKRSIKNGLKYFQSEILWSRDIVNFDVLIGKRVTIFPLKYDENSGLTGSRIYIGFGDSYYLPGYIDKSDVVECSSCIIFCYDRKKGDIITSVVYGSPGFFHKSQSLNIFSPKGQFPECVINQLQYYLIFEYYGKEKTIGRIDNVLVTSL